MSESLRSILVGTSGLTVGAVAAIAFTLRRRSRGFPAAARDALLRLLLLAIALQCMHFAEEFLTGFAEKFPALVDLPAWPSGFFVTFNVFWIAVWVLSAAGLANDRSAALFPIWFLVIAMMANGVAHPLLSLALHGYFPGLATSPAVSRSGRGNGA